MGEYNPTGQMIQQRVAQFVDSNRNAPFNQNVTDKRITNTNIPGTTPRMNIEIESSDEHGEKNNDPLHMDDVKKSAESVGL